MKVLLRSGLLFLVALTLGAASVGRMRAERATALAPAPIEQAATGANRRISPDPTDMLIGTWVLNVQKSTYNPGPPPRSAFRTFDYTHDGMILSMNHTVNARGNKTINFWEVRLDGTLNNEFSRENGRNAHSLFSIKRIDDYNLETLAFRKGKPGTVGLFTLSKDGKTLTFSTKVLDAPNGPTTETRVYEKDE